MVVAGVEDLHGLLPSYDPPFSRVRLCEASKISKFIKPHPLDLDPSPVMSVVIHYGSYFRPAFVLAETMHFLVQSSMTSSRSALDLSTSSYSTRSRTAARLDGFRTAGMLALLSVDRTGLVQFG